MPLGALSRLAPAEALQWPGHIAVEGQRRFELGNRVVPSPFSAQDSAFDIVRPGNPGSPCQGLIDKLFGANKVDRWRRSKSGVDQVHQRAREIGFRLGRLRIEAERVLVQADGVLI